jgi:hypothetical protein
VQNRPRRPRALPFGHVFASAVHAVLWQIDDWNTQFGGAKRPSVVPSGHCIVSLGHAAESNTSSGQVLCVHSNPFAVQPQPLQPDGDAKMSPTLMFGGALTIVRPAAVARAWSHLQRGSLEDELHAVVVMKRVATATVVMARRRTGFLVGAEVWPRP